MTDKIDVDCSTVGKYRNNSNVCHGKQFWYTHAELSAAIITDDVIIKMMPGPHHTSDESQPLGVEPGHQYIFKVPGDLMYSPAWTLPIET